MTTCTDQRCAAERRKWGQWSRGATTQEFSDEMYSVAGIEDRWWYSPAPSHVVAGFHRVRGFDGDLDERIAHLRIHLEGIKSVGVCLEVTGGPRLQVRESQYAIPVRLLPRWLLDRESVRNDAKLQNAKSEGSYANAERWAHKLLLEYERRSRVGEPAYEHPIVPAVRTGSS